MSGSGQPHHDSKDRYAILEYIEFLSKNITGITAILITISILFGALFTKFFFFAIGYKLDWVIDIEDYLRIVLLSFFGIFIILILSGLTHMILYKIFYHTVYIKELGWLKLSSHIILLIVTTSALGVLIYLLYNQDQGMALSYGYAFIFSLMSYHFLDCISWRSKNAFSSAFLFLISLLLSAVFFGYASGLDQKINNKQRYAIQLGEIKHDNVRVYFSTSKYIFVDKDNSFFLLELTKVSSVTPIP